MSKYLEKLARQLLSDEADRTSFINSILHPQPMDVALVLMNGIHSVPFAERERRSEQPEFIVRVDPDLEPGKRSEHERGDYYILDYASVLAALPLTQVAPRPNLLVDLCAAPGGKSILASRFLKPELIIANEVVGARCRALISNFKRCHISPSRVWNNDVEEVAHALQGRADVVLIDAPCSGQSLLAKGEKVPGAFHPSNVNGNSNRQKKILARAAPLANDGGSILYTTCTFALEENESVVKWFLRKFPQFEAVEVPILKSFQSVHADFPCYRVYPHQKVGAGSFSVLLQKKECLGENQAETETTRPPREIWRND